jgi:hypothetical protein
LKYLILGLLVPTSDVYLPNRFRQLSDARTRFEELITTMLGCYRSE